MTDKSVETIESLVEKLSLSAVTFYQVGATLHEEEVDEGTDESVDSGLETMFKVRTRHKKNEFGTRFRVEVSSIYGEAVVDVACEYESEEPLRIPRDVAHVFINQVAVMQAFPYIRESIMTTTARILPVPILLPVVKRGELEFELQGGPEVSEGL
ncbi:hypothetical protein [Clavibacter michiganensis]|uniref:hypothetical protein n=1 Tax=Clavibacter michiganensis TaxID=28447 RepID=UPI003EBFB697